MAILEAGNHTVSADLPPPTANSLRKVWMEVLWVIPIGALAGSASALFLWLLDRATAWRWMHPWALWLLPAAGVVVGFLYDRFGKNAERGNLLIVEEIHRPGGGVPRRMAPLVLGATVITHLFGGSAGREGTAVQMGGSLASAYARWLRCDAERRRVLLMAGVAAGFASVFGTPMTGAIFSMEVLRRENRRLSDVLPLLVAAFVGHEVCLAWGIQHSTTLFPPLVLDFSLFDWLLLLKTVGAGTLFGLCARAFVLAHHAVKRSASAFCPSPSLRPALGGLIVIALVFLAGTRDYLGLSVTSPDVNGVSLRTAFLPGGADTWSWLWKFVFTAVTLGFGFKGGEVTPLFFMGATLGNVLGGLLHAPVGLFAAVGFVALFGGAARTPLACVVMGVELFGLHPLVYFVGGCGAAIACSGQTGLYTLGANPRA